MTIRSGDPRTGAMLTPEQQRLNAHNIARLKHQRAFGFEKPAVMSDADIRAQRAVRKPKYDAPMAVSLVDLAETSADTSSKSLLAEFT